MRVVAMAAITVGGLLLAGCSDTKSGRGSGPTGSGSGNASSPPSSGGSSSSSGKLSQTFDPPLVFDKTPVSELPSKVLSTSTDGLNEYRRSTVEGTVVYTVTDDSLAAIDVETGQEKWNAQAPGVDTTYSASAAPAVVDGRVYAAFESTIPGKGTTPEQPAITVLAVDAESGQTVLTIQVPTPDAIPAGALSSKGPTKVFGVADNLIAVGRGNGTFVVNADTKRLAWQRKDFITREVMDDVVIGENTKPANDNGEDEVLGLHLADGRAAWTAPDRDAGITVQPAGPHLVVVNTSKSVLFLSTVDGKVRMQLPQTAASTLLAGTWCGYDDRSMMVCTGPRRMVGIDPNDLARGPKWQIEEGSGREIPEVSAVFHGAVYGTTSNGPVVLDAVTGADKPDPPQLVPELVNEHVGIGKSEDGTIGAFAPVK